MDKNRFRIDSIHISKTNPKEAVSQLTNAIISKDGGYVCVTNLRMINYAAKHPAYATLMEGSFMNLPDGVPLTWCGKAWGLKNIDVTNGPSTFHEMLSNGNHRLRHFLLGDTQDVLDKIKDKYISEYDTNIVGAYSPPFADVKNFNYADIAKIVSDSGANVVWVAMTAPKQDEFSQILNQYLPEVLLIGVGRAFRLSVGEVKQAPGWAKKIGVGGFFMRRRKWYQTGWWYLLNTLTVVKYLIQIKYWKLTGKKYYE